jgi:hypothetical protein
MKKYFFEAAKKQLEKPTEPLYINCAKAKCWVIAEDEAQAAVLASEKLHKQYDGSGTVLGKPSITKVVDLPVDWSYGYGDERKSGDTASIGDLVGKNVIR